MIKFRCLTALACAVLASSAFSEVPSADALMNGAFATAKKEGKTVFLSFHASWCGWCHKLEDFLKKPEIKSIWDKRFVTVWLTVLENGDKKKDENPGGDVWLKRVGGEGQGIPYIAFFNGNGEQVATSNRPAKKGDPKDQGGNTGYPAASEEIEWFVHMLESGAKNMTKGERDVIERTLRAEAKKLGR